MILFNVTIAKEDRDPDLAEKLKAEWPAILRWMIEGCFEWHKQGLNPPASVLDATNEYLESEDRGAAWIEDRCEVKESYQDTSANLFKSWKEWAELTGEEPGSQKALCTKLQEQHGAVKITIGDAKARGYRGIRVIQASESPRNWVDND